MKSLSFLTVLALAFSYALAHDVTLNEHWNLWKQAKNKQYLAREENVRRAIWESNLKIVNHHNLEADLGLHTYWLKMNVFADMTNAEFRRIMNGFKSSLRDPKANTPVLTRNANVDLPDTVDWRTKGYVTPIKDQGQCGSCWAFSAVGSLEGQHFNKTGKLVSLSEQNLVDCSRKQGNEGCDGGLEAQAFMYIKENNGIDTEESYPYEAVDGRCRFKAADVGATITGYLSTKPKDESALQEAVATIGPISVAIDASHNSFQLYDRGIYNEPRCSQTNLDHAVLAVGYGTESGSDYWLVKNSWGTGWGQDGYIQMSRNKNNQCGIATDTTYPTV